MSRGSGSSTHGFKGMSDMTEAEWLASMAPTEMLALLDGKVSDRQLRLFVCACCRMLWDDRWPHSTRRAIEVAERFADGLVNPSSLNNARSEACRVSQEWHHRNNHLPFDDPRRKETRRLHFATIATELGISMHSLRVTAPWQDEGVRPVASKLLRCIVRYPTDASEDQLISCTPLVTDIARAGYEKRVLPSGHLESARLAVLSDALEEAGCTSVTILEHLRTPGPHVRGCWAVDLILGKE